MRSVHNFFCGASAAASAAAKLAKSHAKNAGARAISFNSKNQNVRKTRISSSLLRSVEIFAQVLATQKVFRVVLFRTTRRASRAAAGRGVYTQN
jgi:hypothetical protein